MNRSDTEVLQLKEYRVTLQSAQEMKVVLGQVKYFVAPKLHLLSSDGKTQTVQLQLPTKDCYNFFTVLNLKYRA